MTETETQGDPETTKGDSEADPKAKTIAGLEERQFVSERELGKALLGTIAALSEVIDALYWRLDHMMKTQKDDSSKRDAATPSE